MIGPQVAKQWLSTVMNKKKIRQIPQGITNAPCPDTDMYTCSTSKCP